MYARNVETLGTILVYGLLLMAALSVLAGVGSILAYIGEVLYEYVVLPVKTRKAREHEALLRSVPRRDLRLPH